MAIHYASVGYTSDPDNVQVIPVGGMRPLKFPRTEQRDPWEMHALSGPVFRMPADGYATIQVDVYWQEEGGHLRRVGIVGDDQPYEAVADSDRPGMTVIHHTLVRHGETLAILAGHDADTPQEIFAARVQIAVDDSIARPAEQRVRIREGTNPDPAPLPERDPYVGEGGAQPPIDPEGPDV